jgi:Ca2+-binding EF-hand superfamily protein
MDELREAFQLFDEDNTGSLDGRELRAAMEALGYANPAATMGGNADKAASSGTSAFAASV